MHCIIKSVYNWVCVLFRHPAQNSLLYLALCYGFALLKLKHCKDEQKPRLCSIAAMLETVEVWPTARHLYDNANVWRGRSCTDHVKPSHEACEEVVMEHRKHCNGFSSSRLSYTEPPLTKYYKYVKYAKTYIYRSLPNIREKSIRLFVFHI